MSIQYYVADTQTRTIHAFASEREREDFARVDWYSRPVYSDNFALGNFASGCDLLLHGETYVPDYWHEYVAWDVEPTADPSVRRAFADVHGVTC